IRDFHVTGVQTCALPISEHVQYQTIGKGEPADCAALAARLETLEHTLGIPANRIFYLALPPAAVPAILGKLGDAGLNHSAGWTRSEERRVGKEAEVDGCR